jgi:hypothetical protein
MFIINAHLDLAMNAMEWNRDLQLAAFFAPGMVNGYRFN